MKIYTVHVKPGAVNPYAQPVFVREGFSIFAFLFTMFWALYHRLWVPALLILFANIGLMTLVQAHILSMDSMSVVQMAMNVLIGFHGNDWIRAKLAQQGYIMADISAADNKLRAEQRYFERYLAATAQ